MGLLKKPHLFIGKESRQVLKCDFVPVGNQKARKSYKTVLRKSSTRSTEEHLGVIPKPPLFQASAQTSRMKGKIKRKLKEHNSDLQVLKL